MKMQGGFGMEEEVGEAVSYTLQVFKAGLGKSNTNIVLTTCVRLDLSNGTSAPSPTNPLLVPLAAD